MSLYKVSIRGEKSLLSSAGSPQKAVLNVTRKLFPNANIKLYTPQDEEHIKKCNCLVSAISNNNRVDNNYLIKLTKG